LLYVVQNAQDIENKWIIDKNIENKRETPPAMH
jgi:hypothetical protein